MKPSELAKEAGTTAMHIGKVRRRVSPDHQGGKLEDWEVEAIRKELGILTDAHRIQLTGLYGDSRFPGFIEATPDGKQKITVQIPPNYEPENFIGRKFWAEQREYSPNFYVYTYNPFKQDEQGSD